MLRYIEPVIIWYTEWVTEFSNTVNAGKQENIIMSRSVYVLKDKKHYIAHHDTYAIKYILLNM